MIHIVEEIKLLLLLGNRLKHICGNVSYLGFFIYLLLFYNLLKILKESN
jgi:hypothetical protein